MSVGLAPLHIFNFPQTKDFVKFLSLVIILYLGKLHCWLQNWTVLMNVPGFLTTFVLLARDKFRPSEMVSSSRPSLLSADVPQSWILIKVFFGYAVMSFGTVTNTDLHTTDLAI